MALRRIKDDIDQQLVSADIPHKCRCGGELLINDNNTRISCENPNCLPIMAENLKSVFSILRMSVDIAENRALEILNMSPDIKIAMDIFRSDWIKYKLPPNLSEETYNRHRNLCDKALQELKRINQQKVLTSKFIEAFKINNIGTTNSQALFIDVEDIKQFFADYPDQQTLIPYIAEKLEMGEYTATVSEMAINLEQMKDTIIDISNYFVFKKNKFPNAANKVYNIAITGPITDIKDSKGRPLKPRESIQELFMELYGAKVIVGKPRTGKKYDFLIRDTDMSQHAKQQATSQIELGTGKRYIISSYEFERLVAHDQESDMPPHRINPDLERTYFSDPDNNIISSPMHPHLSNPQHPLTYPQGTPSTFTPTAWD